MHHFLGNLIGTCGSGGSREIVPSGTTTKSKQPSDAPIDFPTRSGSLKFRLPDPYAYFITNDGN